MTEDKKLPYQFIIIDGFAYEEKKKNYEEKNAVKALENIF